MMTMADVDRPTRKILACNPVRVVRGEGLDSLADAWNEERAAWNATKKAELPIGIGYLSYDLGRCFERIRGLALPPSPWLGLEFRFFDSMVVCESDTGRNIIWARDEKSARRIIGELIEPSRTSTHSEQPDRFEPLAEMEPPARHLKAVASALEYIRGGDIYQVNLARRLGCVVPSIPNEAPGLSLFTRLERTAPAPYSIWLGDGKAGTALLGNSPERFLRRNIDGQIETWPIKGTRPRDLADTSNRNAAILSASPKDRAEHVMIVDLERNDLGRVCKTGSVEVVDLCRMLTLPTVHHLVTTVRGQLRPEVGLAELLRATFPGGSVTGAPKIRAMEIIEELEPARRGPYTGATGWLGAAGDLDLAVAIRTALIRDGWLTLWVGGGIVADSVPEAELEETWDKAQAFSRVLGSPGHESGR
jgi:para-aminobenzoate synthetase component 1